MPLYVFQSSGNPLVRILVGLASLAILVGMAFLMLPVVLCIIAAVLVMGLVAWGWAWYQGKKYGDPAEQMREAMSRAEAAARGRYQPGAQNTAQQDGSWERSGSGPARVETSDKKKWKMTDVEDIDAER